MSRLMTSAAQPLGGDLEGGAGAGGVLEEQVEHALAAQQRHLLDLAVVDAEEGAGGVEDLRQHAARQALDRQQVDQLAVGVELRVALAEHQALICRTLDVEAKRPASSRASASRCVARQRDARRRDGRLDRQLAPATVDQHRQLHAGRPAEVEQLVDHGAHGAAGVQHVVDQHDVPAVDLERQPVASAPAARPREPKSSRCSAHEITPCCRAGQVALQALGQPGAARPDADQHACRGCSSGRTPRSRSRVQRFGVEVQGAHWMLPENTVPAGSRPRPRRHREPGSASAQPQVGQRLGRWCSARPPRAPAA